MEKLEINPRENWDDEHVINLSESHMKDLESEYDVYMDLIDKWIKETKMRVKNLPLFEAKRQLSFEDWCKENKKGKYKLYVNEKRARKCPKRSGIN
jgi:hypothetical protein